MSKYTTKVTRQQTGYICRVLFDGKPVVEARCPNKLLIGPTFRDLLRTMDKGGGDRFTSAARHRGNTCPVKHLWRGKP